MSPQTLLAYCAIAMISILSPGPAVLLAIRNGATYGVRIALWSSLGNTSGLFIVSAATMLGLGALLQSSATAFAAAKILGALYLFYLGLRNLLAAGLALPQEQDGLRPAREPAPLALYREGLLVAVTNPKAILFFTALFPQFINPGDSLLPQFLLLTIVFMGMSFSTLMAYALMAGRARNTLVSPRFGKWISRTAGAAFIAFGAALLALRRPAG